MSRQTIKDLPGTTTGDVYTGYDLAGRPKYAHFRSTTGSGVDYGYDTAKRVTSENTMGLAMTYQYDLSSNRIRVTWPDGNYVNHDFDALNRDYQIRENGAASGVGVLAFYQYDSLSRKQTLTRGNGTVTSYGYDLASRLKSLGQNVAATAQDLTIGLQYTRASQLWIRQTSNPLYDWTPTVSNRTYAPDSLNRYSSVAGTTYAYDGRGNLQSDGTRTMTYDVENRLLSVVGGAGLTLSYDPLGRLWKTTSGGSVTQYLYDGDRLVAEYSSTGTVLRRYVHGPGVDDPVVWYEGSALNSRNWLHADERGSVIATTDGTGTATIYQYGQYGEPTSWTGSRFRYTGQIALPEAQLYHYKARVYDPIQGRFLQTDPAGSKDDLNLYTYVGNDPLDKTDPSGKCFEDACVLEGTVAVEGIIYAGAAIAATPFISEIADKLGNLMNAKQEPGSRPGKAFTPKGKDAVKDDNKSKNGGQTTCENCGQPTTPGQQGTKGVTPPDSETHVDHIEPKSKGGSGTPENGQVLCRGCNLQKGNKTPDEPPTPPPNSSPPPPPVPRLDF